MPIPLLLTSVIIGFLLGGLPSGLWIGRARGVDLRTVGSRNIGATNAYRVLGARWGLLVFVLDAAKGFLAASVPTLITGLWWASVFPQIAPDPESVRGLHAALRMVFVASLAAGVAAILGHIFSPWLGFRGGRGVATSLGVFLAIIPVPTLIAFGIWIALVFVSRRVSVGSIGAAFVYPFLVFILSGAEHRTLLTVMAGAIALLVIVRHRSNIQRLLAGTEPPIVRRGRGDAA